MSSAYLPLLRTPGAAVFFLSAAVGRVGIAMTGLGLIWLVHARTGSYGVAGLATAGFAVTEALIGPQLARLIDRFGQPRVLPFLLAAHGTAVAVVLAAGSPAAMIAAATCAGAAVPQFGALSAARWAHLLRADRAGELPTAFSLESLANATAFLLGPAVVAALGAAGNPAVASAVAATLILSGGGALAAQHRTAPPGHIPGTRTGRPAFVLLIAALHVAVGLYFGTMSVAISAFAVGRGTPGAAAPIILAASLGGLLSGWLYGLRRHRAPTAVQLVIVSAYLTGTALLLPFAPAPIWLGAAAVVAEAAVPPTLVLLAVRTERSVHPAVLTEAFTWNNSSSAAGSAIAAAVAGRLADSAGASAAFALAPAAGLALLVLAVTALRKSRPSRSPRRRGAGRVRRS
ncbi:MFS transporter [Paractinoplanes toevensis]|uniref:MFS transporter n=1 Tax=Paractinoplanes toevensis TaxID=571911 RepID=A0A919W6E5_9ACTN|nr:MFS transporter [Actinoplanes toevensis]GIM94520.1 MFS transporter [Actinoplanes toevensis]